MLEEDQYLIDIITQSPLVYKDTSLIKNAGYGLFANKLIEKNTPIVIYYGDFLTKDETIYLYLQDKNNYIQNIAPYIRDSGMEDMVINGITSLKIDNINLMGSLVNDIANIDIDINQYLSTRDKCNVTIKETQSYPIYYSNRDINKNEELYAHYGIGYWLLDKGIDADKLSNYLSNSK